MDLLKFPQGPLFIPQRLNGLHPRCALCREVAGCYAYEEAKKQAEQYDFHGDVRGKQRAREAYVSQYNIKAKGHDYAEGGAYDAADEAEEARLKQEQCHDIPAPC